jgi:hypothetical protein
LTFHTPINPSLLSHQNTIIMPAWSEKEESSFLRTIVQVKGLKVSRAEWEAISSLMEGDYSANACR